MDGFRFPARNESPPLSSPSSHLELVNTEHQPLRNNSSYRPESDPLPDSIPKSASFNSFKSDPQNREVKVTKEPYVL